MKRSVYEWGVYFRAWKEFFFDSWRRFFVWVGGDIIFFISVFVCLIIFLVVFFMVVIGVRFCKGRY